MWQLQIYCHVQPRSALELIRIRSHSLALGRPPVGSHYLALEKNSFTLSRSGSRSLDLAHTRSHSFAHPLARTRLLEFTHFLSNSLELALPVLQNHSVSLASFMLFLK